MTNSEQFEVNLQAAITEIADQFHVSRNVIEIAARRGGSIALEYCRLEIYGSTSNERIQEST